MKILVFGNFYEGNVAHEIELFFKRKSCEVYKFKRSNFYRDFKNRYLNKGINFFFSIIIEFILNFFLIIKYLRYKPEVFFAVKGLNIYPIVLKFISNKTVCINWNLDDFLNRKNSNKNLIKSMKLYDLIISPKIERFDKYILKGAKKLLFIENFYFRKYFYPSDLKKNYEISFIGSWSKKRDKLINVIANKHIVHVFGNSWKIKNKNYKVIKHDEINPHKFREVVSQSKINLNFLTDENYDTSNLRFFEVSACKGLLLNEYSNRFENILSSKNDTFYFKNVNEINCIIDEILRLNEDKIRSISNSASKKIKDHSFDNRCEKILIELQKII
tara:strand:- start:1192 stop:2181 length:990 start_codon:yes stop_codon:yes gene_type:complete